MNTIDHSVGEDTEASSDMWPFSRKQVVQREVDEHHDEDINSYFGHV